MAIQRWVIHAPCSNEYEKCDEGEWCEWDDVAAELMRLDGEHQARVRELEAAVEEKTFESALHDEMDYVETRLASANALLGQIRDVVNGRLMFGQMVLRVRALVRAFLAGQPATPASVTYLECQLCGDPLDSEHPTGPCVPCHELPERDEPAAPVRPPNPGAVARILADPDCAAPTRTEAFCPSCAGGMAVRMRNEQAVLDAMAVVTEPALRDQLDNGSGSLPGACRAELARRRLKP